MSVQVIVEWDHFPQVLEELIGHIDHQVRASAEAVAEEARQRVKVRTGSTQASIYVATRDASGYGSAVGAMQSRDPKASAAEEERPGEHEALVGVANAAGVYEEYGSRFTPAAPFLTPAADTHNDHLRRGLESALDL